MRAIVECVSGGALPLLRMFIHGAPHRRQHIRVIQSYRDELVAAAIAAGIGVPIDEPVDLRATFINPCSTDLDNLYVALCRALDGKAHSKPTVLADDGLIQSAMLDKFYPNAHQAPRCDRRRAARRSVA